MSRFSLKCYDEEIGNWLWKCVAFLKLKNHTTDRETFMLRHIKLIDCDAEKTCIQNVIGNKIG